MRHELDPPLLRSDVRPPLNLSQTWSGHQVHSVPVNVPLIEFWKQWEWKGIYRRVIISYLGVVRKKQWFYPEKSRSYKKEPNKSVVRGCPPVNWLVFFVFFCHIVQWLVCEIHMGMDQYLLISFLGEWTSIYQLFWCSPGVQGFDTLPYHSPEILNAHVGLGNFQSNPLLNQSFVWEVFVFLGGWLHIMIS